MKDKLIFCDDDTCRYNNGIVCTRDEIKIVLKTVGANTFCNNCMNYEDKRNGGESNGS